MLVYLILALEGIYGTGSDYSAIKEAEHVLGLNFSSEYTTYLEKLGIAAVSGHELTGLSESPRANVVDVTLNEWERNPQIPHNMYVVERAHIDGIVVWQDTKGVVYITHYHQSSPSIIASSIEEYLLADQK